MYKLIYKNEKKNYCSSSTQPPPSTTKGPPPIIVPPSLSRSMKLAWTLPSLRCRHCSTDVINFNSMSPSVADVVGLDNEAEAVKGLLDGNIDVGAEGEL